MRRHRSCDPSTGRRQRTPGRRRSARRSTRRASRFTRRASRARSARIKWAILARHARRLLLPAVPALGPRPERALARPCCVDLANGRFYFFFIELWPQEVYYITGLLILAAFGAVPDERGRRPRLVRLSLPADGLDRPVLRRRAPDRGRPPRAHAHSTRRPGRLDKLVAQASLKHSIWLLIAWWTGGAWVLYFADAPTLVRELATFQAPPVAYRLDRAS